VQLSLAELSALGVKRVSVGGSLARTALGAFLRAAQEMREHGTFTYASGAVSHRDISAVRCFRSETKLIVKQRLSAAWRSGQNASHPTGLPAGYRQNIAGQLETA
jgi:2-methylisocitrate lyase-like PEP mutase family enzyme